MQERRPKLEESITYEEAVARVGGALFERYEELIAEQPSSYMDLSMRTVRMKHVLDDKMSHSKAIAVMFRKVVDDVFSDVTDVIIGLDGDAE